MLAPYLRPTHCLLTYCCHYSRLLLSLLLYSFCSPSLICATRAAHAFSSFPFHRHFCDESLLSELPRRHQLLQMFLDDFIASFVCFFPSSFIFHLDAFQSFIVMKITVKHKTNQLLERIQVRKYKCFVKSKGFFFKQILYNTICSFSKCSWQKEAFNVLISIQYYGSKIYYVFNKMDTLFPSHK